jgi:hypothetical protein
MEISVNYQGMNSVAVEDELSLHVMDYIPGEPWTFYSK